MKNKLVCLTVIFSALGIVGIRLIFQGLPLAADNNAPLNEFSSPRAMVHLEKIAYEKRNVRSPLHAKTRAYIEQYMKKLGYEVVVHDSFSVRTWLPNYHIAASVRNIAARKKGTGTGGAVLIMSHYDSVPSGPGAADAGYGIAAMLESARALTEYNRLKNDIIFLFTDAEEGGLMGANAFLREHQWIKDVKTAVNLEARGTEGPAVLFETGSNNGLVVREFINSVPHPVGNSLSNALYAVIPNDTDYTLFKEANIQGLNFANANRVTAYHTPLDNLKNADQRTLQHHGENTLGLAKSLGNMSLDDVRYPDIVYFNIIGNLMASYPVSAAYLLAAIAFIAFIFLAAISIRKKIVRLYHAVASFGIVLVLTAAVTVSVYGVWEIVNMFYPEYSGMFMGDTYNAVWYRIAFTGLSVLMISGSYIISRKKIAVIEMAAGSILLWFAAVAVSLIYIPAGSYIFLWPLIFAIAQFSLLALKPHYTGIKKYAPVLLLSVPALFFMADTIMSVYIAVTLRLVFAAGLVTALFLIILFPLIDLLIEKGGALPLYLSGIVFIACIAGGSATSGFDSESPRPDTVTYGLDADTGKAYWISCDSALDPWLKQFFKTDDRRTIPEFYPMLDRCLFKKRAFLSAPAPSLDLLPPRADILYDKTLVDRELKIKIYSQRKATEMAVILKTDQGIENIALDGKQLEDIDPDTLKQGHRLITTMADFKNWNIIICRSVPDEGFTVSLNCRPGTKIEVRLLDISDKLPDISRWGIKPRPADIMSGPDYLLQEGIMVGEKYLL